MNAFENLNNGDWIDGNATMVTSYRTWQFSGGWPPGAGWPSKNVHTDDEFATSVAFQAGRRPAQWCRDT